MSEDRESGVRWIAQTLVPQMGSDFKKIDEGGIDQRKFAVLESPQQQIALGHFDYRAEVDGVRFFKHMVDWLLNSSPSLSHGLGRRQVIQTIASATGGQIPNIAERPGWIGRNVTKRSWKRDAEQRGENVVD